MSSNPPIIAVPQEQSSSRDHIERYLASVKPFTDKVADQGRRAFFDAADGAVVQIGSERSSEECRERDAHRSARHGSQDAKVLSRSRQVGGQLCADAHIMETCKPKPNPKFSRWLSVTAEVVQKPTAFASRKRYEHDVETDGDGAETETESAQSGLSWARFSHR